MYKDHLQLKKLPFENVPDPDFFFDQGSYGRALQSICDSIDAGRGLMVVTGPIGSGKTTLSQMIMQRYGDKLHLVWMAEPPQNEIDILAFLARELGLSGIEENRVFLTDAIKKALLETEQRFLFILDEAHLMSDEVAGTLKILNNLEQMSKKLLQIFLLGQDELLEVINKPELASFKQRIAALEVLGRMDREEIRHYIGYRLDTAGGAADVFTDAALDAIAVGSEGVPRLTNTLCDRTLARASSRGSSSADIEDVYDAAQGLVDRKEIFQIMVSVKNSNGAGVPVSGEMDNSATGAQQLGSGSVHKLFESQYDDEDWAHATEGKKNSLETPMFHLLLSSIVLAGSIYYFSVNSPSGFEQVLQWLSIPQ